MQYDFNLLAGQSQNIDVKGRFFKYKSGSGMIRVRTSLGGAVDLLPGQGVENIQFTGLTVSDRSGAANVGSILAGDFDFRDDRIAGSVEVIDGGKNRTQADIACIGYAFTGGLAGSKAHVQLWNPADSGKRFYVGQVSFFSTGAINSGVGVCFHGSALATVVRPAARKRAGASASLGQIRTEVLGADLPGYSPFLALDKALKSFKFNEPMLVPPGYGLVLVNGEAGETLGASFEYFEEPI